MQDTTPKWAFIEDRRTLRVEGPDASDFLNGLVTNEIADLADGDMHHAGLLTPQGKILFEFFVSRSGDAFVIDCAGNSLDDLAKRLGFYKLRAAVEIVPAGDLSVAVFWGGTPDLPGSVDPRFAALGHRMVATSGEIEVAAEASGAQQSSEADYEAHRIHHAVPEGGKDYPLGDTFPHEACFDLLNGVSFSKGCYVGQEVVSRMRHRGTARKRIVKIVSAAALPAPGTPIIAGDRPIGILGSAGGTQGIAMIRLDRAGKARAGGIPLFAGGGQVNPVVPDWADYEIPSDLGKTAS